MHRTAVGIAAIMIEEMHRTVVGSDGFVEEEMHRTVVGVRRVKEGENAPYYGGDRMS